MTLRFIDLATDGGCSKKASAGELRALLTGIKSELIGDQFNQISDDFSDAGLFLIGKKNFLSTVDLVLPMVLKPSDFGKIVTNHVLSDIYACDGTPLFALCILGVPRGIAVDSPLVAEAMTSAIKELEIAGVTLVGGHTMAEQEDFYLGFTAVGVQKQYSKLDWSNAKDGDVLIVTKPLGTSIATLRWKSKEADSNGHLDVLDGMLKSNRIASDVISKFPLSACTDVTGYGLVGHLHNLLLRIGKAARISINQIPVYESLKKLQLLDQTRQFWNNKEYLSSIVKCTLKLTELEERIVYDSQVSGGLLISVGKNHEEKILSALSKADIQASTIGALISGQSGEIELV